jgi:hypothetical protein
MIFYEFFSSQFDSRKHVLNLVINIISFLSTCTRFSTVKSLISTSMSFLAGRLWWGVIFYLIYIKLQLSIHSGVMPASSNKTSTFSYCLFQVSICYCFWFDLFVLFVSGFYLFLFLIWPFRTVCSGFMVELFKQNKSPMLDTIVTSYIPVMYCDVIQCKLKENLE